MFSHDQTGGPTWPVPLGRRDGYISSSEEAQKKLPPSDGSFIDLVRNFANVGLDALDMVILSGKWKLIATTREFEEVILELFSNVGTRIN